MATDPYEVLGVPKTATDKQIRSAFVKLAKTSHPDLNPGDKAAEERFKAINAANDLLSDPEKRARYDRGEIDASGQEKAPEPPPGWGRYRQHAEGPSGGFYRSSGFADDGDLGDIIEEMLRAQAGSQGQGGRRSRAGHDYQYRLTVPFLDAVRGGTQRLNLPEGGNLDVRIPVGLESGQTLRLRGKGAPGEPPGDALIEVEVAPHPYFRREGNDILCDLPVTVAEAMLGGKINVPTIGGTVAMNIPAGSDTGTRLRLRGRGVPAHGGAPAGDAYVVLKLVLGGPDPGLEKFLRERQDAPTHNPRAGMEDAA